MPEGDTVHRVARLLAAEVTGKTVASLSLHDQGEVPELADREVENVEAVGKHMFIHFAGGWSVRVHLGMNGKWRRLHARQRRPRDATMVMVVGQTAYVCQGAYRAETVRTAAARRHPRVARLGPDLLAEPPAIDEAVRRAQSPAHAGREIGDLLLDQRIAAGIGNVYKSEILFECRVHPRTPVGKLEPDVVRSLFEKASHLMRLNLLTRRRTHVPIRRRPTPSSHRLWVYRRAGKPCLDCGTAIERFVQGDMGRSTYFCSTCQSDPIPRPRAR